MGGSMAYADPSHRLAFGHVINRMIFSRDTRASDLRRAVYCCLAGSGSHRFSPVTVRASFLLQFSSSHSTPGPKSSCHPSANCAVVADIIEEASNRQSPLFWPARADKRTHVGALPIAGAKIVISPRESAGPRAAPGLTARRAGTVVHSPLPDWLPRAGSLISENGLTER